MQFPVLAYLRAKILEKGNRVPAHSLMPIVDYQETVEPTAGILRPDLFKYDLKVIWGRQIVGTPEEIEQRRKDLIKYTGNVLYESVYKDLLYAYMLLQQERPENDTPGILQLRKMLDELLEVL